MRVSRISSDRVYLQKVLTASVTSLGVRMPVGFAIANRQYHL
jgi:hypothetical protein